MCSFDALYLHNTEGLPGDEIGSITKDSQKVDGYFVTGCVDVWMYEGEKGQNILCNLILHV